MNKHRVKAEKETQGLNQNLAKESCHTEVKRGPHCCASVVGFASNHISWNVFWAYYNEAVSWCSFVVEHFSKVLNLESVLQRFSFQTKIIRGQPCPRSSSISELPSDRGVRGLCDDPLLHGIFAKTTLSRLQLPGHIE